MTVLPDDRTSIRSFGTFHVTVPAPDSTPYPLRGGGSKYVPREVMLTWETSDGQTWKFLWADISGPYLSEQTGRPSPHTTSQRIWLNDPNYQECEPHWLAALVTEAAPGALLHKS